MITKERGTSLDACSSFTWKTTQGNAYPDKHNTKRGSLFEPSKLNAESTYHVKKLAGVSVLRSNSALHTRITARSQITRSCIGIVRKIHLCGLRLAGISEDNALGWRDCLQNFTGAFGAWPLGQLFIFGTIFQLWVLSPDVLAAGRGLFTW
mgnify:CR=1 FL=1